MKTFVYKTISCSIADIKDTLTTEVEKMTNKKWEYTEVKMPRHMSMPEFFNQMGQDGWEYVRESLYNDVFITFKRPYYDE